METMNTIEVLLTGETKRDFFDHLAFHHYSDFEDANENPIGEPAARELWAAILRDAPAVDLAANSVAGEYFERFQEWREELCVNA
jgi:hypothetical protein